MAIYYDNFESYGTITTTPFGSFTSGGASIVAANYVTTGSRAMQTRDNAVNAVFTTGGLFSAVTVWVAFFVQDDTGTISNRPLLSFQNGPPGFSNTLFEIYPQNDWTLSCRGDGAFGGNSQNFNLHREKWTFLQANVTTFDVAGTIAVTYDVGIEGTSVMTGTFTTTLLTTNTPSATAQWDHLILYNSITWDEFTLNTQTTMGVYPNPGTPKARTTTALAEVIELQQDANIRITTGLIELVIAEHGWEVREA